MYSYSIKLWWQYCQFKSLNDSYEVKVFDLIVFLNNWFRNGAAHGALNNHSTAISLISASNISDEDRLKRFFKGVLRLQPTFPCYTTTWDPAILLNYLSNMYPNENLTIQQLFKKLLVLLVLATGQRSLTLSLIR